MTVPSRCDRCEVCVEYRASSAAVKVTLGEAWAVRLTRELRDELDRLLGEKSYSIHYRKHIV